MVLAVPAPFWCKRNHGQSLADGLCPVYHLLPFLQETGIFPPHPLEAGGSPAADGGGVPEAGGGGDPEGPGGAAQALQQSGHQPLEDCVQDPVPQKV